MKADRWRGRAAAMRVSVLLAASIFAAVGASAASVAAEPQSATATATGAPRADGRYANLYPFVLPSLADLADWYWTWWRAGGTKPPRGGFEAVPVDRPDLDYLRANRRDTTATWVGHATVMLQLGGVNVLTDPQFSSSASPIPLLGPERKVRVPFTIAEAPRIDVVLISHNHYDHLDGDSVDALAAQAGGSPLFIVPLGVDDWMRKRGIDNVIAMDWWQSHDIAATSGGRRLRITFVPTQHWSARTPTDRFETLWGGYVVERLKASSGTEVDYRFFFAGDTGYAPLFRERIHPRFDHFDFAAIPIGAYEPHQYLRAQHVDPAEAVMIHRDLDVAQSMGIHWGTFVLTSEPFDQPPKDLARALEQAHVPADRFVVFRHGEMRVLEKMP